MSTCPINSAVTTRKIKSFGRVSVSSQFYIMEYFWPVLLIQVLLRAVVKGKVIFVDDGLSMVPVAHILADTSTVHASVFIHLICSATTPAWPDQSHAGLGAIHINEKEHTFIFFSAKVTLRI